MTNRTKPITAIAAMLVRKPVAEVFEAFINPEITTKFWFTKSSGRLAQGKQIEWTWEMYNLTLPVLVSAIEQDKRIEIEWGNYRHGKTTITWTFKPMDESSTFVSIVNSGFDGDAKEVIAQVRDATEGFTLVLAGLKAFLEYNIQLNLVADRFPRGIK